jgi:hypothetical protein
LLRDRPSELASPGFGAATSLALLGAAAAAHFPSHWAAPLPVLGASITVGLAPSLRLKPLQGVRGPDPRALLEDFRVELLAREPDVARYERAFVQQIVVQLRRARLVSGVAATRCTALAAIAFALLAVAWAVGAVLFWHDFWK